VAGTAFNNNASIAVNFTSPPTSFRYEAYDVHIEQVTGYKKYEKRATLTVSL